MTKKAKQYPNPKFSSLEEEDEYWKTHSPLDEGYEGEVQKSKRKRSSFLSLRLTGEELTQIRDMAAKLGMGPSTYARQVLRLTIEQEHLGMHTSSGYKYLFSPTPNLDPTPKYLYDSTGKHESILKRPNICILNTDAIKVNQDLFQAMLDMLHKACECRIVTPEDDAYKTVELIVKASK